ncbi:MAG: glycosyltransferase family 1 protein [Caldilineaceae bacterium]
MIIGIDASRTLRPTQTGTEKYSLAITQHLLALPNAAHHHWRLYTDRSEPESIPLIQRLLFDAPAEKTAANTIPAHVEICALPAHRLWTHRALAREIGQRPPDALFIPAHVVPFVLPPRRLPPTVVTIHDMGYRYFPQAHRLPQRLYLDWSTRWSVTAARKIIAVSQATADDIRRFYPSSSAKISVIHEAAGHQMHTVSAEQRVQILHKHGVKRPFALFVGTLQPRKNLSRLIQAYAFLRARQPVAWDLLLVGQAGLASQSLYELTAALGLVDHVHFLSYVEDGMMPALFATATFFCFPSLFEGFGLPVLEAQSYGVPVMTANNSSLPEVAGEAALLVDPTDVDAIADAMLRLSQDEELRQRLIRAGYENVKRFSWEQAAAQTLAVLEGVGSRGVEE